MKKKEQKSRLQFDITDKQLGELDALVKFSGATSRAHLFRNALRLYAYVLARAEAGETIILRHKGREKELIILL